jgi:hypothetical protein
MSLETEFHTELENRAREWAELQGGKPLVNYQLPNGKIADIFCFSDQKVVSIIEVKTSLISSLIESSKRKYYPYCHFLWVAAPAECIMDTIRKTNTLDIDNGCSKIGLLAITERSVSVYRNAERKQLPLSVIDYFAWHTRERRDAIVSPYRALSASTR